jgi:hypothetical protein
LNFLARQIERRTDMASLRDDMSVLTAVILRLDGTVNAPQETRATHSQIARMNGRIRKLRTRLHSFS